MYFLAAHFGRLDGHYLFIAIDVALKQSPRLTLNIAWLSIRLDKPVMNPRDCQGAFHQDGSLRDIYVQDVTIEDWEKFFNLARSGDFRLRYFRDQEAAPLPSSAAHILKDRSCAHNLVIDLGKVEICCHFFAEDEIELDIDPREVTSAITGDRKLDFMARLGAILDRDVILTEENSPNAVWFVYTSKEGVVRCVHNV